MPTLTLKNMGINDALDLCISRRYHISVYLKSGHRHTGNALSRDGGVLKLLTGDALEEWVTLVKEDEICSIASPNLLRDHRDEVN